MRTIKMLRHGEHSKPHYLPSGESRQSTVGKSTAEERPDGELSGIVKRFDKKTQATKVVLSLELIKTTYADAIEYTSSKQTLRGMVVLTAVVIAILGVVGADKLIEQSQGGFFDVLSMSVPLYGTSFYCLLWASRLECFCPVDQPIIFDRKHRKVYSIFRETQPGFLGMFRPWPMRICEYDWDLIDVEHNAALSTTGSTVLRNHALIFLVKRSAEDPTIIDSFNIGNSMELGESTVPAVWEHIRRFMEEGGPHLPPGEAMAPASPPQNLWQSSSAVGPIGAGYFRWWREESPLMLLFHALFFFFVPMFLLWGLLNWLSYKTATHIAWPKEVKDAVGPAQKAT